MKIFHLLSYFILLTALISQGMAGGKSKRRASKNKSSHQSKCNPRFLTKAQTLNDEYMMLVQGKVQKLHEPAYEIKSNNYFYYVEGGDGQKHEIKAAREVSEWLRGNTSLNYLHIPSLNSASVPSVDGTLFADNVLYPKARLSLKSIFAVEGALKLEEKVELVVIRAMLKDQKFNSFRSNFNHVMRRENGNTLSKWINGNAPLLKDHATHMSILGFKFSKAPPLVVVVKLEQGFEKNQVSKIVDRLEKKLQEIKERDLHSILLINKGEVFEISRPSKNIQRL